MNTIRGHANMIGMKYKYLGSKGATAESGNDYVRSKRKGSSFVSEQTNVSLRLRMSLCFRACTFHMLKYACAFVLMLALACTFMLMLALQC